MSENQPADVVAARQAVYRFLRAALILPCPEQHAWMRSPAFARSLHELTATFGVGCPEGELVPCAWPDHESRYLACFEVGLPTPPVPPLASHYQHNEPVPRIIHEHILFYRRFGIPPPASSHEPADHLGHQLGFLIHLDGLVLADRVDAESALLARRDFLSRHVRRWVGQASRLAEVNHLPPVYRALLAVLAAAVAEDVEMTAVGRVPLTVETT